jgi:hypothetical protein
MLDRQRRRRLADMEQHNRTIAKILGSNPENSTPSDPGKDSPYLTASSTPSPNAAGGDESSAADRPYDEKPLSSLGGTHWKLSSQSSLPFLDTAHLHYEVSPLQVIRLYIYFWHGDHVEQLCGHRSTATSPKNPDQWLYIINQDEGLMYGQAYAADAHLLFAEGQSVPVGGDRFGFRDRAIAHINRSIEALKGGIDDGTIASVLAVAAGVFWEYRSRAEFIVHLNGLRKMVQLKGGLPCIELRLLRDLLTL